MNELPGVVDEAEHHRFVLDQAELIYRVNGKRLVLVHTEVPPELGGQGIGGRLVQAAIDRARATGETLVPWCPYARTWLERHPDAIAGLTIDWSEPPQ